MYYNARARCRRSGQPEPEVGIDWIERRVRRGVCEATGIPFDFTIEHDRKTHHGSPLAPSLDRKDSSKPYTKDNCQVVVVIYNLCKSDYDHKDVVAFCKAVAERELDTA